MEFKELKKCYLAFTAKSTQEYFEKWGLKSRMNLQTFKYTEYFDINFKEDFVRSLLQKNIFKTFSSSNCITQLSISDLENISVDVVPATFTSISIFDRLYKHGIVRECGSIKKCFDSEYNGILISDVLHKLLVDKDSPEYKIFSFKDRNEFIFQIFQHLVLGGYCCQYEDLVQPYLDLTKHLYKDFLYVYKDIATSKLQIGSIVLKVALYAKDQKYLFPGKEKHEQNFFYLILNPLKREVITWQHLWNI